MDREDTISDVNTAWNCRRYDIVLQLLEGDSDFPNNFATDSLDQDQSNLFQFVKQRQRLHECISKGELKKLKHFPFDGKSKFYVNSKNESAAFTAIKHKQFQVYAFLNIMAGAELKSGDEQKFFDALPLPEKHNIEAELIHTIPPKPNFHIDSLCARSKAKQRDSEGKVEKVRKIYEDLDKMEDISTILHILHYADFLEIIFDFDKDNIANVYPSSSKYHKGETLYKDGRLYVAAGSERPYNEILATVAHELTHMAMEIVYKNDCNPYLKNKESEFEGIRERIKNLPDGHDAVFQTFVDVFQYDDVHHDSELIARVPEIIAEYSFGVDWLNGNVGDLFRYYEEVVLRDCKKFLKESFMLKSKTQTVIMNESLGEIERVKKYDIYFEDVALIQNYLRNQTSKIFLISGESTWLTALRALQALSDKSFVNTYDNYLILEFDVYMQNPLKVIRQFYLDGCDTLMINDIRNSADLTSHYGMRFLEELLDMKKNKRIIFTVKNAEELPIKNKLIKIFGSDAVSCFSDGIISLFDLDQESRIKVINTEIFFQGLKIPLENLINSDESLMKIINAKTIVELVEEGNLEIGSKACGMANLEGAYANLSEEMNSMTSLISEMQNANNLFLFDGFHESSNVDRLKIERGFVFILQEKLKTEGCDVPLKSDLKKAIRRAKFVEHFTEEKFKQFCQRNPEKAIYWVKRDGTSFILQQLYNFNFYLRRHFVVFDKLFFFKNAFFHEDNEFLISDQLIISNTNLQDFLSIFDFSDEETNETDKTILDGNEFHFVEAEETAKAKYESLTKNSGDAAVHWLKKENDELIWKKSSKSFCKIRKCIDTNSSVKASVNEEEFLKRIINEKIVIIADDPGMGKTTTLTKLYDTKFDSRTVIESHWVISMNFKDHIQAIKNINLENLNIKEIIKFFSKTNPNLKSNLAKNLLDLALNPKYNFSKPLLISFDGFDELLDESDREKIISSLKFLKEETKSKIWITTRIHYKEILENNLSTFAMEFEPIDDDGKEEFIKKYLENRLKHILSAEKFQTIFTKELKHLGVTPIFNYTKNFIIYTKSIFQNDVTRFIGTPLQLYLLLEGSVEYFKENYTFENFNFTHLGKNPLEIFKNFIDRKYKVFYNKFKADGLMFNFEEIKETCNSYHMQLAKHLILNADSKKVSKKMKNNTTLLSCGIIKCEDGHLKFIHTTFGEYFASKIFFNWINKSKNALLNTNKIEYLITKILTLPDYKLIRIFLNFRLNKRRRFSEENLKTFGRIMVKILADVTNSKERFIDVLIREELLNLFHLSVISLQKVNRNILNFVSYSGEHFFIYACRCCRRDIIKYIFKRMERMSKIEQYKLLTVRGKSKENCLHHAALYHDVDILNLILDKAKELCSEEELYKLVTTRDNNRNTPLHLAISFIGKLFADCEGIYTEEACKTKEIYHYIFRFSSVFFENYSPPEKRFDLLNQNIFERSNRLHSDVLKRTLKQSGSNLKDIIEESWKNYKAVVIYIVILMLEHVPNNKVYELIGSGNVDELNLLHLASMNGDKELVQFLLGQTVSNLFATNVNYKSMIERYQSIFQTKSTYSLITSKTRTGLNALHIAATFGHGEVFKFLLNMVPPERVYAAICESHPSFMHKTVLKGHSETVKMILIHLKDIFTAEQMEMFLMSTDKKNYTILHVAAEKGDLAISKMIIDFVTSMKKLNLYVLLTARGFYGFTVLHSAFKSNAEVAEYFLNIFPSQDARCILKLEDDFGRNILHIAASQVNGEFLRLLLKKLQSHLTHDEMRACLFEKTNTGYSVLHTAVAANNLGGMTYLLPFGK